MEMTTYSAKAVKHPHQGSFLTQWELSVITRIVECLIPRSPYNPGATDVGVPAFIDHLLANDTGSPRRRALRDLYHRCLALLDQVSVDLSGQGILDLDADQLRALISRWETGDLPVDDEDLRQKLADFFQVVRLHTIQGFLSHPRHGGNIDCQGWTFLYGKDGRAWLAWLRQR